MYSIFKVFIAVCVSLGLVGCSVNDDEHVAPKYSFIRPMGWKSISTTLAQFTAPKPTSGFSSNISFSVTDYMSKGEVFGFDPLRVKDEIMKQNPGVKITNHGMIEVDKYRAYKYEYAGKNNKGVEFKAVQILIQIEDKAYTIQFGASPENYEKDLEVFNKFVDSIRI